MAISNFAVQKRGQTGSWTSDSKRNYTVVLQCQSTDPLDGPNTVLTAAASYLGIPLGTPAYVVFNIGNDYDPFVRLKKMTAACTAGGSTGEYKEWLVTLEYDSEAEQLPDNPLQRPTQISGSFSEYMKPVWKDRNGKAITNAAKRKFDPPIELPDARPVLTMTRNETTYDMALFATSYVNRINSTAWFGGSAGQWRCVNIAGTGPHVENDIVFYTLTYEFQFRYEGWQPSIANAGTIDISGKPVVDNYGNKVDAPAPLHADGTQVFGTILDSDWTFITPNVFFEADFTPLGLP